MNTCDESFIKHVFLYLCNLPSLLYFMWEKIASSPHNVRKTTVGRSSKYWQENTSESFLLRVKEKQPVG
jgi:hypothetical protein